MVALLVVKQPKPYWDLERRKKIFEAIKKGS